MPVLNTGDCLQVSQADGTEVAFPPPRGTFQAALLCIAFRAGAEVLPSPHAACLQVLLD